MQDLTNGTVTEAKLFNDVIVPFNPVICPKNGENCFKINSVFS